MAEPSGSGPSVGVGAAVRTVSKSATLQDVADAAGMSKITVSRAIRKPHLLNKTTLDRVNAAIAALEYRPNLTAQHLRGSKTRLVLVIVPSLSPFFLEIFRGVEEAAQSIGYTVFVGHSDRILERELHFMEEVSAGRADGVIAVTSVDLSALSSAMRLPPMVVALDVNSGNAVPTVRVDHAAGSEDATRYLAELGHRRIAHIAGPAASDMTTHRLEGYERGMRACGLAIDPNWTVQGDFSVESGEAAAMTLLSLPARPTAIFASNDEMAIGAVRAARRLGLTVPGDVSIMGFDDERIAALYEPALSTVRIPAFEIGHRAMLQMQRLLQGEAIEANIILETELTVRRSTGVPPKPF